MVGDNTTLWGGLVAVLTLLGFDIGLKAPTIRSRRFRRVIEGEPRLLVRDGRLLSRALAEEKVTRSRSAQRSASRAWPGSSDVRLAVLETDGSISVIPMSSPAAAPTTDAPDA